MNNTLQLILIISLIVTLNTFVVVIAVRLIFNIRINKQKITEQVREKISSEIPQAVSYELRKTGVLEKQKTVLPEEEEKKESKVEEKKEKPKFLKYTEDGYIYPGEDVQEKKHVWR